MAEIVRMPKLSDTMTEGVVAEWHKKEGDKVSEGDLLAEIETDKATMEFESFYDGVLLYIGVKQGDSAPVNEILAIIGDEGENVEQLIKEAGSTEGGDSSEKEKPAASSEKKESKETKKEEVQEVAAKKEDASEEKVSANGSSNGARVFASPLAKKMAAERGISLANISGSGENSRIVKRDVENYQAPSKAGSIVYAAPSGEESYTEEAISQMRKTIAKRLADSKFTAPHFYLTMEIDMDNAIAARKAINADEQVKVSFNDLVIKAVAHALRRHPQVNSAWLGDTIRKNQHVHIGVAVAVPEGLLVPVVRFADTKGLVQIGQEVKEYAEKARNKKLQPEDWEGNTFTISNLGMFGIEEFTAIINPPDSCILAVGGIKQTPVVKNGEIVPGNVMKVTLSCDHRVVDGVTGSEFLQTFKKFMENPVQMIV
ncbi:MAG: pyruvate dehydrogenase complex dihydrolipoamide acetyltransferase [Crocinitomicaceae bacterium]